MNGQKQKHVFISYVRENQKMANKLYDELSLHGVKVWLDRNEIKPGSRWKDAIREAIRQGDFFIACFSEEYTSKIKTHMNEELVLAIEVLRKYPTERIWFIPVLFSECDVPARSIGGGETLLDIQWVALYEDWISGIKKILSVIKPIPPKIQSLIYALDSEVDHIRLQAVDSLGRTGEASAAQALIRILNDEDEDIRLRAATSLGRLGEASAVPSLVETLNDEDEFVRQAAITAIGRIGEALAIPALLEISINSNDTKNSVKHALRSILRNNVCNSKEILALLKVLYHYPQWDDDLHRLALKTLTPSMIPSLVDVLDNTYGQNRETAVYALGQLGYSDALPALKRALKDDDSNVRSSAAGALSKFRDFSVLNELLEALRDESGSVRHQAAQALGIIGDSSAIHALVGIIENDRDANVRIQATKSLGLIGDSGALPTLKKALNDENMDVRAISARALGRIGDSSAILALKKALNNDKNEYVRKRIVEALQMIGTPQALKIAKSYTPYTWLIKYKK